MKIDPTIDWSREPNLRQLKQAYENWKAHRPGAIGQLEWLAANESAVAMLCLGDAHRLGRGAERNIATAEKWYRRAAEAGSPRGHFQLGHMYLLQGGILEGRRELEIAHAEGYVPATRVLAQSYLVSKTDNQDRAKARHLFEFAAMRGSIYSESALAWMLIRGDRGLLGKLRGVYHLLHALFSVWLVILTEGRKSERLL